MSIPFPDKKYSIVYADPPSQTIGDFHMIDAELTKSDRCAFALHHLCDGNQPYCACTCHLGMKGKESKESKEGKEGKDDMMPVKASTVEIGEITK